MYFSLFEIVHNGVLDQFCLSDTLVVFYLLLFFFKDRLGRVGPETDPNPRQTRILDPNPTQASIQPTQDPSGWVKLVGWTGRARSMLSPSQIKFKFLRRDEILRLESVRARNGGGQACELVREMVGGGTWWRIRPTCELQPWKYGEERAYFQLD